MSVCVGIFLFAVGAVTWADSENEANYMDIYDACSAEATKKLLCLCNKSTDNSVDKRRVIRFDESM